MRKSIIYAGFIFAANLTFAASPYTVHGLISDVPDPNNPNLIVEPSIVDPWGIAISASSPFWISNAGTGLATVYSFNSTPSATCGPNLATLRTLPCAYTVNPTTRTNVPSASGGPGRVTGQIAGAGLNFAATPGGPFPSFLFCTEDGTISVRVAPNNNNDALITVNNGGNAVYKGCAAAVTPDGSRFYAANFKAGTIDVFDTSWNPVTTAGGFVDPNLPAGLNPFNVWVLGQKVYVAYAKLGPDGVSDAPGRGNGVVDIFDLSGNLMLSINDPSLNSPWGLAIAPEFFGDYSFALLVGNFGDGRINAFDTMTGAYLGTLSDSTGKPIALEGLWGLQFGNGQSGGDAKSLYFAAGISGGTKKEAHGLFGSITTP
jgi:uncharacterized protein (TIGR03118 family)